ncbi:Hypothetical protein CINCED_3A016417 [Cinara cedri]|uniref:Reverse transcriptase domain n=1 Tax=Cinara cedri TaxID=506608 RepID=A0A5E4M3T9_9HEMI|nr:Hypothetical protein CINCED_3A016417 [Cinara cedri]
MFMSRRIKNKIEAILSEDQFGFRNNMDTKKLIRSIAENEEDLQRMLTCMEETLLSGLDMKINMKKTEVLVHSRNNYIRATIRLQNHQAIGQDKSSEDICMECAVKMLYGSKTWTIAKEKQKRINIFEMWCNRIMLNKLDGFSKKYLKEERYEIVSRKGEMKGLDM